jgi:hypothetical protein
MYAYVAPRDLSSSGTRMNSFKTLEPRTHQLLGLLLFIIYILVSGTT